MTPYKSGHYIFYASLKQMFHTILIIPFCQLLTKENCTICGFYKKYSYFLLQNPLINLMILFDFYHDFLTYSVSMNNL